jgi:hypothetical protein
MMKQQNRLQELIRLDRELTAAQGDGICGPDYPRGNG